MRALVASLVLLATLPAAAQDQGNHVVAFAQNSAQLAPETRSRLDALVQRVRNGSDQLMLAGHADPGEGGRRRDAQVDLSQRRAKAVRDYLVAEGIDASRLTTQAYGAPASGGSSAENRSVTIKVGASGGW